ncbi:MAG TPA: serine/threonine-protein kinase [Thermoanaerobaculia bacterium]|nr:serine/threonine-protein kinase [Thermoanaerobaculia bacterium]
MTSSPQGSSLPEKIGHYTIVSELGRGGMGIVYKAHEESLNRFVAIKVLSDQLASDEEFLSRFLREARAAGALSHPNVIPIYFVGEDNGRHYFAMEYVSGRSVMAMIRQEGKINNPRASQIVLQAAHGLAAAHEKGIIHRDIKPANLMVDDRGVVKIADFGIALAAQAQARLTATGTVMGTPGYLSPEQCLNETVDHRTDIYALGVTYFEMLTGRLPFNAESPLALLRQILQETPPDVAQLNPEVDAESRRILMKMIARNRDERYQSCNELIADLEEYLAKNNVRSVTANLGVRSQAAPGAAAIATVQITPSGAATEMMTSSQAPASPSPAAPIAAAGVYVPPGAAAVTPAAPPLRAQVTAPDIPIVPPAAVANAAPQARSSNKSAFAIVIAVLLIVGLAAAGLGFMGYRYLKGRGMFGGQAAQEASMLPAPAKEPAKAGTDGTHPVDPASVELSSPKVDPLSTTNAEVQSAPAAQQPAAQMTVNAPRTQSVSVPPVKVARVERQQAESAPAPAPSRHSSRIAVSVQGEAGLNASVARVVTRALESAGFDVVLANDLPATERLGGQPSTSSLIDHLRGEAGVLVVARIEATGERELKYYGRYDTAYDSRVTLTAYDVATAQPIGSRMSASLEYTHLNADDKTDEEVTPIAQRIARGIRSR